MHKPRRRYSPEFRARMVELVRVGRSPSSLAREFEPTAQAIGRFTEPRTLNLELRTGTQHTNSEPGTRNLELTCSLDTKPPTRGLGRNHVEVVEYRAACVTDAERVDEPGSASTGEAVGKERGALRGVFGDGGKA